MSDAAALDEFMASLADDTPMQAAPASATSAAPAAPAEDEVDPLDAFMQGIDSEVSKQKEADKKRAEAARAAAAAAKGKEGKDKKEKEKEKPRSERADIELDEEDARVESALKKRKLAAQPNAAVASSGDGDDSDEEPKNDDTEYDSDGNPVVKKSKKIAALDALDHSKINYEPFRRNFYEEHAEVKAMSQQQLNRIHAELDIKATGSEVPRPCIAFNQFGFGANLMKAIEKMNFDQPTAIQAQAIPAALQGRDVIGIARTGSGKTGAFVWPMIVHISHQRDIKVGEGPIGLVVAPTRELAQQIFDESQRYAKSSGVIVAAVMGGMNKYQQTVALKQGCHMVVATPGRLLEHVTEQSCTLRRVTYLVLDEADRMFAMGFERQVRSIVGQIRPDRQTLLFSATMPRRIEGLARDILKNPIRIAVGTVGAANKDIRQVVLVLGSDTDKWPWLVSQLPTFTDAGQVLIFVSTKAAVDELVKNLRKEGAKVVGLHGDILQHDRMNTVAAFKQGIVHVLVATDVAARGLDIKGLKTVVNFDVAKNMDAHVHRIGRTGRAGEEGTAYTLITQKQYKYSALLVDNLEEAEQPVPPELLELAMQDPLWARNRRAGGGRGRGIGGAGSDAFSSLGRGPGMGGGRGVKQSFHAVAPPSALMAATELALGAKRSFHNVPPPTSLGGEVAPSPAQLERAKAAALAAAQRLNASLASGSKPAQPPTSAASNGSSASLYDSFEAMLGDAPEASSPATPTPAPKPSPSASASTSLSAAPSSALTAASPTATPTARVRASRFGPAVSTPVTPAATPSPSPAMSLPFAATPSAPFMPAISSPFSAAVASPAAPKQPAAPPKHFVHPSRLAGMAAQTQSAAAAVPDYSHAQSHFTPPPMPPTRFLPNSAATKLKQTFKSAFVSAGTLGDEVKAASESTGPAFAPPVQQKTFAHEKESMPGRKPRLGMGEDDEEEAAPVVESNPYGPQAQPTHFGKKRKWG